MKDFINALFSISKTVIIAGASIIIAIILLVGVMFGMAVG